MSGGAESEIVVAGAGTGKTHALVNAYVLALFGLDGSGVERSPARVLAITFTDKAASEMRRRVAVRLGALSRDPRCDEAVNARLAEVGGKVPDARTILRMSRQLQNAPISTFHTMCSMLLRDLALFAGVDPGFQLLDADAEAELLAEAAEALLLDRLAAGDPDVAELSARFSLKRLGAGAGLVDSLVAVHQALAERGLAATDTAPAVLAAAAEQRVVEARAFADELFTSLWALVKAADKTSRGSLEPAFTAYRKLRARLDRWDPDEEHDLAAQFLVARNSLERARVRGQALALATRDALLALRELGAALSDRVTAPHAEIVLEILAELDERARREKDQLGVLGFGDLLVYTRDLLREQLSVRARVKGRFDRILVDEYQDTSPVQEDLVALLAEEPTKAGRVERSARCMGALELAPGRLFVVGDPKQSIYGFRGADVTVFQHTLDVVTGGTPDSPPSGRRRALAASWRSRPPVLALVNQVALATLDAGGAGVPMLPDDVLTPRREGEGKAGELWVPTEAAGLDAEHAEALVIARRVRALLDGELAVGDGDEERACRAGDVVVLVRRVKRCASIVRALTHQGVPTLVTGGEGFFHRPEVMDLIAALQLVVEPEDDFATLTVLRSPLCALRDDDVVKLVLAFPAWRGGLPWPMVAEAAARPEVALDDETRARVAAFDALLTSLRGQLHATSAARMIDALLDEAGYAVALGVERDAAERLANVEKLRALCEGRPGDALRTIYRMWSWLDDPPKESIASIADPDVDAVRIMTVHQAKGLEFPVVVVADAGSRIRDGSDNMELDVELGLAVSPWGRPIATCTWRSRDLKDPPAVERLRGRRRQRDEAELARLLYVALTRARDFVFVVGEEDDKGKGKSLRALLEQGRRRDPRAFAALLPTLKVPARLGPSRPLPAQRVPDVEVRPTPARAGPLRLVPSALAEPLPESVDAFVPGGQVIEGNRSARRRGRLAHQLIGRLGELLGAGLLDDEAAVSGAAVAAARACGEDVDVEETRLLMPRVVATVDGPLRRLVEAGCALSFEEPVRTALGARAVVVGAADLVARGRGFTAVVELKSSRRGADDPATRVQLAAYARALEEAGEARVLVAAWVIGDDEPPAPGRVDAAGAARLDEVLRLAAPESRG